MQGRNSDRHFALDSPRQRRSVRFVVRPLNMLRRTIMVLCMVLMTVALILHSTSSPWQRHVSLSFIGYTNDYSGARVAMFTLSNHNNKTVRATPFGDRVDRQHKLLEPRPR